MYPNGKLPAQRTSCTNTGTGFGVGGRGPRLPRRAADAGLCEALRGGNPAHSRCSHSDPRRLEFRRGRRSLHRQRPSHGLHRDRADDAPGRPHGVDGDAGVDSRDPGVAAARRGVRADQVAGPRSREGARQICGKTLDIEPITTKCEKRDVCVCPKGTKFQLPPDPAVFGASPLSLDARNCVPCEEGDAFPSCLAPLCQYERDSDPPEV